MVRNPLVCFVLLLAGVVQAQTPPPPTPQVTTSVAPSLQITLHDALARGRKYGTQVQGASLTAALAKEDRVQAKAATLPSVNAFNQFIYTQGNGTPSGVFVANDGVHIYNEQAIVHQELLGLIRHGEINRARAAEAVALARIGIARRGIDSTVVGDYYAILAAQRKLENARASLVEAEHFLDITTKQEAGGEAAHADVVRAELMVQQRQRDIEDYQLAAEKARIGLGVLIFPDFRSDFSVEDDLESPRMLPPLPEAEAKALVSSPDLEAAKAGIRQAGYDVNIARYGYLPSLGLDFFYGINANQFAARTYPPDFDVPGLPFRQNLGYSAQVTLNIPVWNWGATRSRVKQAEFRKEQAQLDFTLTQKSLQGNVASYYKEAQVSLSQLNSLRNSNTLSAENLRLTLLRYTAGEATAFEVSDAQATLTQARNAVEDGLVRYRLALANLQILTGSF